MVSFTQLRYCVIHIMYLSKQYFSFISLVYVRFCLWVCVCVCVGSSFCLAHVTVWLALESIIEYKSSQLLEWMASLLVYSWCTGTNTHTDGEREWKSIEKCEQHHVTQIQYKILFTPKDLLSCWLFGIRKSRFLFSRQWFVLLLGTVASFQWLCSLLFCSGDVVILYISSAIVW